MIGMGWMSAGAQRLETAPAYAPLEISFNYSYARSNAAPGQCGCFNMGGGSSEVAFHAFRALSVVADLTGERAASIGATAGDGLSLVVFTVGPRFSHRFSGGKFTPFVQGLVGAAHGFDGLFPGSGGSVDGAANALAVLAGGGLDLTINRHSPSAPSRLTTCVHNCPTAKATNRTCCARSGHRLPHPVGLVRRFISLCCYWLQRPPPDPPGSASG